MEAVSIANLITEAGTTLGAAIGVVWELMTANAWLTLGIGASVIGMGFTYFRKAKRATRG